MIEVVDDGDVESGGTSLNPVLAKLIAVPSMYRLESVAQIVNVSSDILKGPALASLGNPAVHIMAERAERDQSVVGRAASKDLGTRVTDMAVAHGLLCRAVVVVQLAAKQTQPLPQVEDMVEVEIRGASLDEKDTVLRQIGREARRNHAARGASANDDVVEGRAAVVGKRSGRHDCCRGGMRRARKKGICVLLGGPS